MKISSLKKLAMARFVGKIITSIICPPLYVWAIISFGNGGYEYLTKESQYSGFIPYSVYKAVGSWVLDGENGDNPFISFSISVTMIVLCVFIVISKKIFPSFLLMLLALVIAMFCFLYARY